MTTEARRTALARRALAANGARVQRLACAGELFELSEVLASLSGLGAQLIRDSLGRHDERALAEEIVGAQQTIAAVRLTLDPEILAAAELAQADKLEAKLEGAEAACVVADPIAEVAGKLHNSQMGTSRHMARILWENLSTSQQAAMRDAAQNSTGRRELAGDTRADTTKALRHGKYIGLYRSELTPMGLAVRDAGMRP